MADIFTDYIILSIILCYLSPKWLDYINAPPQNHATYDVYVHFILLIIAEAGVVCPEESTTSPNIDWYQVSGCYEAVAMCSTELTNIIGESCACPLISHDVTFHFTIVYVASQDKLEDSVIAQVSGWSLM